MPAVPRDYHTNRMRRRRSSHAVTTFDLPSRCCARSDRPAGRAGRARKSKNSCATATANCARILHVRRSRSPRAGPKTRKRAARSACKCCCPRMSDVRSRAGQDLRAGALQSKTSSRSQRPCADTYRGLASGRSKKAKSRETGRRGADQRQAGVRAASVRSARTRPSRVSSRPRWRPTRDKDGNAFVVVLCLSANTREAFKASEAAYLSLLKAY